MITFRLRLRDLQWAHSLSIIRKFVTKRQTFIWRTKFIKNTIKFNFILWNEKNPTIVKKLRQYRNGYVIWVTLVAFCYLLYLSWFDFEHIHILLWKEFDNQGQTWNVESLRRGNLEVKFMTLTPPSSPFPNALTLG